jgi:hypothetical protein
VPLALHTIKDSSTSSVFTAALAVLKARSGVRNSDGSPQNYCVVPALVVLMIAPHL